MAELATGIGLILLAAAVVWALPNVPAIIASELVEFWCLIHKRDGR